MKSNLIVFAVIVFQITAFARQSMSQNPEHLPEGWAIVASYTIPGKASGLAWDGTHIYFGIYGTSGNNIYKFDPSNGSIALQCSGTFGDAYGLTYKSPNLVTVDQPSSSSQPANALEFNLSGVTSSTIALPDHYMSGIAWDNGSWWVCTYYPDPGKVYNLNSTGAVLSQFTPPANQPWDICKQGDNLWIADYNANMLYKVSSSGVVLESHASNGQRPSGVVFDGTWLWYCDGPLGGSSTLYKIDLSGTGTPAITLPATAYNFGAVSNGESSTWNCEVYNTGNANLTITGIQIPAGEPVNTTFSTPQTITPGSSLMVPLKFTPTVAGPLNTTINIVSNDPLHPEVTVILTGYGVHPEPHILLTHDSHDYGLRRAGAYSRWFLPVTNDGHQNLIISDLIMSDDHFIIDESVTLPLTLPPLGTTQIPLWFHPTQGNEYNGILSIISNAGDQGNVDVNLSGIGDDAFYPIGTTLWTYAITGGIDNSPKSIQPIDDITGDGVADVVVGSEDYTIRCFNGNSSGTADLLWEKYIYSGSVYHQNSITTTADIDGDGYQDVIIGTAWGDQSIVALSGKTGQQLWKHDTHEYGNGGWVYQVDSRFDYNADGFPDVLAATGNDGNDTGPLRVYCLNGLTGHSIWERPLGGAVFSVIGVADFTGDSHPDVIAGATNISETAGRVIGIDGSNGSIKWTYNTTGTSVWGLMQLDDINGDGIPDAAAGDFSGRIVFLDAVTGSKIHELSLGSVIILRLIDIGDANKNGFRDVLIAHSGTSGIVVDGKTCTAIWSKPLSDKSWCVANVGDITWDGTSDAIIGTLYQNNRAYFLDGFDGTILNSFAAYAAVDAMNAIPDITGDYSMEMLFGDRNGLLTCLSGGYDAATVGIMPAPIETFRFLIYPNPNDGLFQVKLISSEKHAVRFRLNDLQGRVVQELPFAWFEAGLSTIELHLSEGLEPGIYFLEAASNKGMHTEKLILR